MQTCFHSVYYANNSRFFTWNLSAHSFSRVGSILYNSGNSVASVDLISRKTAFRLFSQHQLYGLMEKWSSHDELTIIIPIKFAAFPFEL